MPKKTILVIEDDAFVSSMVKAKLEKSDYNIIISDGSKEALAIILERKIDLIIADVIIPGEMDGFHLFKEIRNNKALCNIPFVIITGRGAMKDTFELFDVDAFFVKPFSLEALTEKINSLLEKKVILLGDDVTTSQNIKADLQKMAIDLRIDFSNNLGSFKEKINAERYTLIIIQDSTKDTRIIESCLEAKLESSKNKNTPFIIHSKSSLKISSCECSDCEVITGDYISKDFSLVAGKYL